MQDSDIGRRRRERAVDALEQIDGVVAASVQLGAGSRVDAVRLAIASGHDSEDIRVLALGTLRELGYELDHQAVLIAPIGGQGEPSRAAAPSRTEDIHPQPGAPQSQPADAGALRTGQEPSAAAPQNPAQPPIDFADLEGVPTMVEDKAPPPMWQGRFLVLDGVEVRRADARVICTVRLKRLGDSFSAEVQELDTMQGRARAAARATLLAAEQAGEGVGLSLEGVVIQEFFGRQYVMAFVDGVAHRRFGSLSGILAVEHSLETAAALAILRAVERWVAW